MTHVATAVISASPKSTTPNGTFPVTTNRATQLRNQRIAQQTSTPTPAKRQQSFAIKSRIEIFENKENVQSGVANNRNPRIEKNINQNSARVPSHIVIVNNQVKEEQPKEQSNSVQQIRVVHVEPKKVQEQLSNGHSNEQQSPFSIVLKKVQDPAVQTQQQRYRNVVTKQPSISIAVAPWTPGAKVVTDSDQEEVERILAHRRKLIENSIDAERLQNHVAQSGVPKSEFRPLSLDFGDESNRESAGASLDVLFPRALDLARHNVRMLWKDVRGVVDAGLAENLEKDARTRQEAKFELMLSEGSFLHGLNTLKAHFMHNIKKHIPQVVSEKDYELLFKYVEDVRLCSDAFLTELDAVWQCDPMLTGIYTVINTHATNNFQAYVRYCRNMLDMSTHLRQLTAQNKSFAELLNLLTSREGGQRLTLDAYLTAPMQRITKLPLLLRTILDKTEAGTEEYSQCAAANEAAGKIAQECDEVVNERKRLEEVLRLSQEIEFAEDTKTIPIMSPTRALVSRANVKHFAFRDGAPRREKLHLILFNDLLLISKKKSDIYLVVDWCTREQLGMKEMENGSLYGKEDSKQTNPVVFTMLNNSQDKKLDLVVTFKDQTLCKEWLGMLCNELIDSLADDSEVEQMIALHDHEAADQSELSLSPGDVIKVLGQPDEEGWCTGELVSDGTKGRFPISKTTKITSSKVKAANIKAKKEMRASKNLEEVAVSNTEEETN